MNHALIDNGGNQPPTYEVCWINLLAVEANMALNEDIINSLHYFFTEKDVDRWTRWEEHKDEILQELPLLKLYLEKEMELEALGRAVQRELEDYDYS